MLISDAIFAFWLSELLKFGRATNFQNLISLTTMWSLKCNSNPMLVLSSVICQWYLQYFKVNNKKIHCNIIIAFNTNTY